MNCLIVLPAIDPNATRQFVAGVHPSMHGDLLIIDNCHTPLNLHEGAIAVRRFKNNLGVARSWNFGVTEARRRGSTHVVLVSANVKLGEAGGRDIPELLHHGELAFLPAPTYWHTAIISTAFFDIVGQADENFYPAYYEDADLIRRGVLQQIYVETYGEIDAIETRPGHGVDRLRNDWPGQSTINYELLADYWFEKWGCHVAEAGDPMAGFKTPFNRDVPLDYWPRATVPELRKRYGGGR